MASDDPLEVSGCLVFSVEDLCFAILKRLPVKSLCRFRCVCRSWNSLITSPSFVAEHFSLVASAAEKSYLLSNGFHKDRQLFALYHPHKTPLNHVTYLDHPFQSRKFLIVDVIHGIVCLLCYDLVEPAILWNPSAHKYLSIPWPHSGRLNPHQRVGFGFQSSKGDFKVMIADLYRPQGLGPQVCKVFSLQSGLWMDVASDSSVGSYKIISRGGCFVNGVIHWIASSPWALGGDRPTYALLCFDCEHDKLNKMEFPQQFIHSPPTMILRCGSKLSVYNWLMRDGALEQWVMDKYGVVSTWNKLFRIEHTRDPRSIIMRGEDGDILVYNDVRALAKKTKKRHRDGKLYLPVIASVFEESLFSLEQKSQVPRR